MIQLNKSTQTNTVAFYPEATISASVDQLFVSYSQDINKNGGSFRADITSKNNWVVATISGSDVPAPSGLYTLQISEIVEGDLLVWNTAAEDWEDVLSTWNSDTFESVGALIATERAYISGSNNLSYSTYLSQDENGFYVTYQS
jgi:hypothetical protein